MKTFADKIVKIIEESIKVKQTLLRGSVGDLERAAKIIISALKRGKRVYLFGNGGSAADAQHIAAELVGKFEKHRKGLSAIALTTDTSILTSVGNDYGFENIFVRQLEAMLQAGDVALGITTSGKSVNVLKALQFAKENNAQTVAFTGEGGKELSELCDVAIVVGSGNTARIQETHILLGHVICSIVEEEMSAKR